MLTNFTKGVEEREEVLHIFFLDEKKKISSLSVEQHFIAVKSMMLDQ